MHSEGGSRGEYTIEYLPDTVTFDPLSLCAETLFTQSDLYYRWQLAAGKIAKRFLVKDGSQTVAYAQCFFTPVRFLGGRGYWYAPYGPVCVAEADHVQVRMAISKAFSLLGLVTNTAPAAFFRLDLFPVVTSAAASSLNTGSSCPRFLIDGSLQPRSEWVLPLAKSEAELLAGMHQKARYSIQYAQRKGVTIQLVGEHFFPHLDAFCRLMQQTASRDGFVPHPDGYYKALFAELENTKSAFLVLASYGGEVVSIAVVIGYGQTATYVFGASSDTHRNVSASALVQWTALLEAKRRGYAEYNFGGVSSERFPVKTWKGITTFKQRFGGHGQTHSPIEDVVFQPFWYGVFVVRKWAKRYLHI
ncbi:MAG: peptidoglycan bridge formation glycyltransferase FemA/FemB family protein [Patescibacteria group bacterium]